MSTQTINREAMEKLLLPPNTSSNGVMTMYTWLFDSSLASGVHLLFSIKQNFYVGFYFCSNYENIPLLD